MKAHILLLAALAGLVASFSAAAANVYQSTVSGQSPAFYFKLDGNFVDSVSGTLTLSTNDPKLSFTNDIFGNPLSCVSYGAADQTMLCMSNIINGASAGPDTPETATNTGSISLLFRMLSVTNPTGQRFVFSQGTNQPTHNTLQLFMENNSIGNGDPNSLKLRVGNSTTTIVTNQFIIPSVWYYFCMTYDLTRDNDEVHWYIGPVGTSLLTGTNNVSDDSVVADSTVYLTIGNKSGPIGGTNYTGAWRNTGGDNGLIDEFAVWNRELTTSEINAEFGAASGVVAVSSPLLNVALSGGNVLLSWTTNNTSGFTLQSTPVLPAVSWTPLGSGAVVGTNNVVTNAVSASSHLFYRLQHQ